MSFLTPKFVQQLSDPDIKTILLCGCGGGFDFVHSMVLYPELIRLGKQIIIGSYSFGQPSEIKGHAPVVFEYGNAIVKRVTAQSKPPQFYCPEVHLCAFLDQQYPDSAPHFVYAYYARTFAVPQLKAFYQQLIDEHNIDAIVLVDGGSDSLMVGDEEGLGDPVEDVVSVATVAQLDSIKLRLLINIGVGVDRFNHVSDGATLRAISELTQSGGYLGAIGLDPSHHGLGFYRDCVDYIYENQTFRSVVAGMIISASEGYYGGEDVPPRLETRVRKGEFFVWSLMSTIYAFDIVKVAERSLMVDWIADCLIPLECHHEIFQHRAEIDIRQIEDLPDSKTLRYVPRPKD